MSLPCCIAIDTRDARTVEISSFRPPSDGTDTLRGAEGFLETAESGDRRPLRRQETLWQREGRICVAAGLRAETY